jgi:hypothetical protein
MMTRSPRTWSLAAAAALLPILAASVSAQGNGKSNGNNNRGGANKSTSPNSTALPPPAVGPTSLGGAIGSMPFAWIDDANVLAPGSISLSISAVRWQGTDLSEVDVPVLDVSVGVHERVRLGATIPHVVGGAAPTAVVGGVGTSFLSGKIALLTGSEAGLKLAVAPTIEILGTGVLQSLATGERRTQFGLPVSAELDHGALQVFGSAGFFTGGVRFTGAGVGGAVSPRVAVSVAVSRAWSTENAGTLARDRREISGGAAASLTPHMAIFGSLGTTIATTDDSGAGTTVGGGVTFTLPSGLK